MDQTNLDIMITMCNINIRIITIYLYIFNFLIHIIRIWCFFKQSCFDIWILLYL